MLSFWIVTTGISFIRTIRIAHVVVLRVFVIGNLGSKTKGRNDIYLDKTSEQGKAQIKFFKIKVILWKR